MYPKPCIRRGELCGLVPSGKLRRRKRGCQAGVERFLQGRSCPSSIFSTLSDNASKSRLSQSRESRSTSRRSPSRYRLPRAASFFSSENSFEKSLPSSLSTNPEAPFRAQLFDDPGAGAVPARRQSSIHRRPPRRELGIAELPAVFPALNMAATYRCPAPLRRWSRARRPRNSPRWFPF